MALIPPAPERLFSTRQVADVLGCTRANVNRLANAGKINGRKLDPTAPNSKRVYTESELCRYLASLETAA